MLPDRVSNPGPLTHVAGALPLALRIRTGKKTRSGPAVIILFPCSTQLSMKFSLLVNVKMPTIVGILTFMSGKNSIICLSEPNKSRIS